MRYEAGYELRSRFWVVVIAIGLLIAAATVYAGTGVVSHCEDSNLDQVQCIRNVADRMQQQLERDWAFLASFAKAADPRSVAPLEAGILSFQSYVQAACESEGHGAMGASGEELLIERCRRDLLHQRRKLVERIAERAAMEAVFGRPICNDYFDVKKPDAIPDDLRLQDVEILRSKLDLIGREAANAPGISLDVATLPRSTHESAERFALQEAKETCTGILYGFCRRYRKPDSLREAWVARCQTDLASTFYRRSSKRIREL